MGTVQVVGAFHTGVGYPFTQSAMPESMPVVFYVELFGGCQGLFLLVVWLRSPDRHGWAGRFLTLLLGVASMLLCWMALHDSRWLAYVPNLIGFGPALPFLFGPLLYGYLKATVQPTFRWRRAYWLHSLPFWLVLLGHIAFYGKPFAEKQAFVLDHYAHPHLDWWGQLPLVHFLIYLLPVMRLISQHNTALEHYYSAPESLRLTWLRHLIIGLGLCYGGFGFVYFVQGLHPAGFVMAFGLAGFVYFIGYRQIRQPALFQPIRFPQSAVETEAPVNQTVPQESTRKYQKSPLPADRSQIYADQLNQLMTRQERYRDGQLTLPQVANELAIAPHALSQVLNQTLGVSFYDYINGHRVGAVKQALVDPRKRHLTILALAFEAGFESKAAFNNAFKKQTGLTPTQYRRQLTTG